MLYQRRSFTVPAAPEGVTQEFWDSIFKHKSKCFETTDCKNDGYGYRTIKGRRYRVHRLVWEEAFGTIPEGLCVLHRCDNPACININHLFLGTQQDNVRDRDRKGRGSHKYTKDDVEEILAADTLQKRRQLAARFHTSAQNIRNLRNYYKCKNSVPPSSGS